MGKAAPLDLHSLMLMGLKHSPAMPLPLCTHRHVGTHRQAHRGTSTDADTQTCTHAQICRDRHRHTHRYIHTHRHTYTDIHTHGHTDAPGHTQTYIHIRIDTQIHMTQLHHFLPLVPRAEGRVWRDGLALPRLLRTFPGF